MSDIVAAARLANAHDFISALPDGYQTEIGWTLLLIPSGAAFVSAAYLSFAGDDGISLTADQRFRINVARAVLKVPKHIRELLA
jgi:ABC-type protease/lipase transport system fused ATPase/permease subunit